MPAFRHHNEKEKIHDSNEKRYPPKNNHGFNVNHEAMASSLEQLKDICVIHE
jgi:hypothetical protein